MEKSPKDTQTTVNKTQETKTQLPKEDNLETNAVKSHSTTTTTPTTDLEDTFNTVVIADEMAATEQPGPTTTNKADEKALISEDLGQSKIEEESLVEDGPAKGTCPKEPTSTVKDENGFVYYKCRFCGLTFNFMTTLKAHERVHDVMQPYLCNKCGEAFHYMCELEYHAKQHLKQKGYKCDCGRTFYQYTDLLYHRHPGEEDPIVLPMPAEPAPPVLPSASSMAIDPASFPTPEFMEKGFEPKHPLKVYSDIRSKPYICQYCSKSYADSRGLAYHMYSHRGERMFNPRSSRYLMCRNENSYMSPGADV